MRKDITETRYVTTREEWRDWLATDHADRSAFWLVSYRKYTGRASIPNGDAVEEALCVGWIDSTRKGIDDQRCAQRFTPRRVGSSYSQTNRECLTRLRAQGKLTPWVEAELAGTGPVDAEIPDDIRSGLRVREGAWECFRTTFPAYQRLRIAYVDQARHRPAEFARRLNNLIEKSARGEQFGYGIEDYF